MEKAAVLSKEESLLTFSSIVEVLGGSLALALISQIAIPLPFSPVPISMQTMGVFLLGLSLGSKKGAVAVILYLVQATYGLPVLAGGLANPLWMFSVRVGYLLAFVPAAYLVGRLLEQKKSLPVLLAALFSAQVLIYFFGAVALSLFVGVQNAIALGVIPFLIGDLAKICLTVSLFYGYQSIKYKIEMFIKS